MILLPGTTRLTTYVIALNHLDRFNNLVGDFMKWNENTPEFQSLNELYGRAEEKKVLAVV